MKLPIVYRLAALAILFAQPLAATEKVAATQCHQKGNQTQCSAVEPGGKKILVAEVVDVVVPPNSGDSQTSEYHCHRNNNATNNKQAWYVNDIPSCHLHSF